ncbi:MAG: NACHT domain-containing NTPase [Hyphomicrobiaceae bacterium]
MAPALGRDLNQLLSALFAQARGAGSRPHAKRSEEGNLDVPHWRAQDTEIGRLYQRLNKASELTANRTNVVQDEPGLPIVTLQDQLYVRREMEDEVERALEDRTPEDAFIVIDGEAGTGKSSVLWATARMLRETGSEAWLVDAIELPGIFAPGGDGTILSDAFRELLRNLSAENALPVLLIDTIDVPLNRSGADVYVTALLTELALAGVTVVAASRPGEARMLSAHRPHTILLFDYSDTEFPRAVTAYARAYVRDRDKLTPEAHAERVLEAAAQGYPIKEICRNPLTLRMLYAIYAPQEINFPEVDVITLFREFWHRRVESDRRTHSNAPGALAQKDLSDVALRIAAAMLVAGAPELPRDRLVRELQVAGLDGADFGGLQARGVIRVSRLAPDHLVGFFHQSFFEHAAAVAILRLGGARAIAALAERWAKHDGNLFLGAVLERVLVLSEYEPEPTLQEAERVIDTLDGPTGKAIAAYVFVHRRTVPDGLAQRIQARVVEHDAITIERLLAIGANAVRPRRLALIEALGTILETDNTRWVRRALELLLRFASPDLAEVRGSIQKAEVGRLILKGANKHTQSREFYLRFLALGGQDDPQWSLREVGRFLADGLKRKSETSCLDVLEAAAALVALHPRLVRQLEKLAGLDRANIASRVTSEDVARKMGDLYLACWRVEGVNVEQAIAETVAKSGLAMLGRLHALGDLIAAGTPAAAVRAFELTGELADATLRVMAARIAWTRCLPAMLRDWAADDVGMVTRRAKDLAGDVFGATRNGHADILYHLVRHGDFTKELARHLLDEQTLRNAEPWMETRVLGHRLVKGVEAGIEGAQAAFDRLTKSPADHALLARAVLVQLRELPVSQETQAVALRLAIATGNAEAAHHMLKQSSTLDADGAALVPAVQQAAEKHWRTRNPKTMRIGSGLMFELIRLEAADFGWDAIVARVQSDKDDLSTAQLVRALGLMAARDQATMKSRLQWLLAFAKGKGPATREAVLAFFSEVLEHQADVTATAIEDLFELAFTEPTDGNLIDNLQVPLFILYREKDPRAPALARVLVDRSAPLSPQTCYRVCGTFKRLFGLIVERMDRGTRDELLSRVPLLHKRLGRMILEGVARSGGRGMAAQLKAIAENPKTDPEIVTLAGRFLHRELRVGGLERWPELYQLLQTN